MDANTALRDEVIAGLSASQARLPTRLLYDSLGSRLFDAITLLPEYGLTRTEHGLLAEISEDLRATMGPNPDLIELGCGCCRKAASLFPSLQPSSYLGVDISGDYLQETLDSLREQFPEIDIRGHVADFSARLTLPDDLPHGARQILYLGSSLGNFTRPEAIRLIREALEAAHDGGLLLGLDLMRDEASLTAAYDDALGVTAAFNRNILLVTNRVAGTQFRPRAFRHVVTIQPAEQRVELYLEALEEELVSWPGGQRLFQPGERILTEYSHKYSLASAVDLLEAAGGTLARHWLSTDGHYLIAYARPRDRRP